MAASAQLTYYGHSAFKLVTPSGKVVLIDPWVTNPLFDRGKEELAKLDRVDLICVTHGHGDHVGDAVEIAKRTKAKLVATYDCALAVKMVLGYPAELADTDAVGHIGGNLRLLDGEITGRFTPAWHGSSVMKGETSQLVYAGTQAGLVLAIRGGPTIYHTGDTDLFSDMSLVSRFTPIDWMLCCMGDHFTMGPERAAAAVELVKPKHVVPIHHSTFPLLTGTPETFRDELQKCGSNAELHVMKPGDRLEI
jgi:L-ascorbate metabolism protein UlaG (beta-lactamase superfamily)